MFDLVCICFHHASLVLLVGNDAAKSTSYTTRANQYCNHLSAHSRVILVIPKKESEDVWENENYR